MTHKQENTRRHLVGNVQTRTEPYESAIEALSSVLAEGSQAPQYMVRKIDGLQDPQFVPKKAAAMRTLVLKETAVIINGDGQIKVGGDYNSAGETISIDRAIFKQSRAAQAGMGLEFWPHLAPKFAGKEGLMYTEEQPKAFAVVNPSDLALIPDDADIQESQIPIFLADIDRHNQKSYGVRYKLNRRKMLMRGERQTAAELMTAIVTGLSRVVDKIAVEAILANNPTTFSLAKAAESGARYKDLRGLVGTNGDGAFCGSDNELKVLPFNVNGWQAGGIPAELTPVTSKTIVGQFDRALAVLGTDMSILVSRLNKNGDVNVEAWLGVDVAAPNAGRFWLVQHLGA